MVQVIRSFLIALAEVFPRRHVRPTVLDRRAIGKLYIRESFVFFTLPQKGGNFG